MNRIVSPISSSPLTRWVIGTGAANSLRHVAFGLAIGIAFLLSFAGKAEAQISKVTITVNKVNNKGCFDRIGLICGSKPDMMVRVGLREPDGTMHFCLDTTPIANFDNIGPLSSCAGEAIEPPFDVVISLFDVDENSLPPKPIKIQEQMRLSNNAPYDAVVPWFQLGAGTIAITGPDANVNFTISMNPVSPAFQDPNLSISASSFDPKLGEHVFVTNHLVMADDHGTIYPATTHVRISVRPSGGASTLLADATIHGFFNLDWDGKLNGQFAPPGTYFIDATLATGGATQSAQVVVASQPTVFQVSNPLTNGAWNPRAGPLNFPLTLNPAAVITTRVDGPALAGGACTAGSALPIAVPSFSRSIVAGVNLLAIDLINPAGIFLPSGNYCAHFDAKTSTGAVVGSTTKEFNLNNAPPLRLVVTVTPSVPALEPAVNLTLGDPTSPFVPSTPIFVDAHVYDDLRKDRPTGNITVRAMPLLTIPISSSAISTAMCQSASSCRVLVSAATLALAGGSTSGVGTLAFDAFASDLPNKDGSSPPASMSIAPRGVDLTTFPNRVIMVSAPLTGSTAAGFDIPPRSTTIDVAFHAGTGLDLLVNAQSHTFVDIIDHSLRLFFGGNASVLDTSVMSSPANIAFWVSQKPATVVVSPNSTETPLCDRTHVDSVPFAEVQAIIHTVKCRDNADWNGATFSAELGGGFPVENIVWHEFHHAAYDLADEYAPDGGYFETSDLPNVMSNANECTLKGAEPTLCAQIGTTGWWRAAPMPDVMIDNTRENLDEKRRGTYTFNRCKGGQC